MRTVTVLGSTGSIGTQAMQVIAAHRDQFKVVALAAGGATIPTLAEQILDVCPQMVGVADPESAQVLPQVLAQVALERGLPQEKWTVPQMVVGPHAAQQLAAHRVDVVLNAMSGAVGLPATVATLRAGNTLALANKESLIIGGAVVTSLAHPGQIVPVDSEHSALAQGLRGENPSQVARLVLTASGGPFRGKTRQLLSSVTPQQALAHPTWSMGPLVTINSATLMNKGLELIEAHLLFDIPFERLEVVVHPQSVVHSMVEFVDGTTMASASPPDMRIPIALGLSWPDRLAQVAPACDWSKAATWEFFPLDEQAFPAVRLARQAGQSGGIAPAVMNAANEESVSAFLAGKLDFLGITEVVEQVLHQMSMEADNSFTSHADMFTSEDTTVVPTTTAVDQWVEEVDAADASARQQARTIIATR